MKTYKDRFKTLGYYMYSFIHAIPFYLMRVFPIKEKSVYVYGFVNQGFGDHPKYIITELLKMDKDYQVYWATSKQIEYDGGNIKYINPNSLSAVFYQATSKFWISTVRMPYHMKKRRGQIYFQTWHGAVNLKRIEGECLESLTDRYIIMAKHDSKMIDYLIAANQDKYKLFSKYFWFDSGEILKTGSPRNDIFYTSDEQFIRKIRDKYSCGDKKIMLYAPTFRANRSLVNYKLDYQSLINAATKRFGGEWIAFVRLHPTMSKRANELVEYNEVIRNGSIIDDIQELLLITDLLITDYSSIVFDYMDTGKPAILYAPDIEEYAKERDFHINPYEAPFPIVESQEELLNGILCFDENEYESNISQFAEKIGVYDDGTASKTIAAKIVELT